MPVFENKEWTRLWYDEAADRETPRVMLIGDSVTAGYTQAVNRHLDNQLRADSIASSKALDHPAYMAEIDFFACEFGFDYRLIHFNNGLHGWHLSAEEYGRQLDAKVSWLMYHFPGAKLTLATSTPVTVNGSPETLNAEKNAVVVARNEQVKAVARRYNLPVDDLYAAMVNHPEWRNADGFHYNEQGADEQGRLVADYILEHMKR